MSPLWISRVIRVGDRLLSQLQQGLIDQQRLYSYEENELRNETGQVVWQGQMDVESASNQTVKTIFNVRQAVPDWKPGAYVVTAKDAKGQDRVQRGYYYQPSASQWIIDSDLGLTTFHGSDGLHVFVRSLSNATPEKGLTLAVLARKQ